ncbi:hypothetical protein ACHAXA_009236 [Cyclostephanos tholiformis]|uniref:J domain-containing protein n=1 Tax=Cyclostephanos tholiformis TaxID=382380 RepID=A0ABD3R6X7_9STRA
MIPDVAETRRRERLRYGPDHHDWKNERPAENSMSNEYASSLSLSPVANWKYSAARACENLNRILIDIHLLEVEEDDGLSPRRAGCEHTAVDTALSDMIPRETFADERKRRMGEGVLVDERREEDDESNADEASINERGRIMEEGAVENEGREVNYDIYVDETVAVTLQEEDENEDDEVNRLLTERRNLLERTNLVESLLRARGRKVEEQELCASTKVVLIDDHARRMDDGGMKCERINEEYEENDERKGFSENLAKKREKQMETEMERGMEINSNTKTEPSLAAAGENMTAEERMRSQWAEEEERSKNAEEYEEMCRKMEAAVAETKNRKKIINEARDAAGKELAENQKREEQIKLVERILQAAANDAKGKNAYYIVLDIAPTASMAEIKKSYRKLALRLHPDKDRYTTPNSVEAFNAVSCAYDVLKDASSRSKYDQAQNSICCVVSREPPSVFNTIPRGTRITVQSTDTRFTNLNGQQGSILEYDEVADLYLVKVEHHCDPIWSKTSALFQNVIVCLRAAKAMELGTFFVTLMSYYKDSRGGCYEASYEDDAMRMMRTAYLLPDQFIIPNGTIVHVESGMYGVVVDWNEVFDHHTNTDCSYYEVRLSPDKCCRVHMRNIRV